MAGVTDTVFRRFIRNLGGCGKAGLVFECAAAVRRDVLFKRYSSIFAALLYFDHD